MRKDVREALKREKATKPKRVAAIAKRRGPHDQGMRSAARASYCRGCGSVVNREDGYRTAKGIWCPPCAASFDPLDAEQAGPPAPEPPTDSGLREWIDDCLLETFGTVFSSEASHQIYDKTWIVQEVLGAGRWTLTGRIKGRWEYAVDGIDRDGEPVRLIVRLRESVRDRPRLRQIVVVAIRERDVGEREIGPSSDESTLRPAGILPKSEIRKLLPPRVERRSTVPITVESVRTALGIKKQQSVPCDGCGCLVVGTPYHLADGRYCADCVFRAGQAAERRERAKGSYLDDGTPDWLVPEPRRPVGTTLKPGQALYDWKGQLWLEIVTVRNGHDVATDNSPDWWMWNPERAFRFIHGELFRDVKEGRWTHRALPDYVRPYFEDQSRTDIQ